MQHKGVAALTLKRVDDLRVTGGSQGHGANSLRFTTGEECRTVSLRQYIHLAGNRSDRAVVSAVDARLTRQNTTSNNVLFKRLEHVFNVVCGRAVFCCELGDNLVLYLTDTLIARRFLSDSISFAQWPRSGR